MQRRLLYTAQYVAGFRNALREARDDLYEMHCRHLDELDTLRREVAELREILLMITGTLRTQAEADLVMLRRQLESALVRLTLRDPTRPLH